jgi:hypothetical protein
LADESANNENTVTWKDGKGTAHTHIEEPEIVGEHLFESDNEKRKLSELEVEASALASDPNVWYATKYGRIIQLLEEISLQQKLMLDLSLERIDKEKKMQEQLGGMFGVIGNAGSSKEMLKGLTKSMFSRHKDEE